MVSVLTPEKANEMNLAALESLQPGQFFKVNMFMNNTACLYCLIQKYAISSERSERINTEDENNTYQVFDLGTQTNLTNLFAGTPLTQTVYKYNPGHLITKLEIVDINSPESQQSLQQRGLHRRLDQYIKDHDTELRRPEFSLPFYKYYKESYGISLFVDPITDTITAEPWENSQPKPGSYGRVLH